MFSKGLLDTSGNGHNGEESSIVSIGGNPVSQIKFFEGVTEFSGMVS